jgi:hypothetical protein
MVKLMNEFVALALAAAGYVVGLNVVMYLVARFARPEPGAGGEIWQEQLRQRARRARAERRRAA